MIRARFHANLQDPRPIKWPIKYPYWVSGEGDGYCIVVAYADNVEQIHELWPEAANIDVEERDEITFTDRFAKPTWWDSDTIPHKVI